MNTKKKLVEGDIFYIERNGKYIFGRILLDVNQRVLKKEPEHIYKFYKGCYLVNIYKGIYDVPELETNELILLGQFTFKKPFYSKDKYKVNWFFYKHEPINYKILDFPETIRNREIGIVMEKFDIQLDTKIKSFNEMEEIFNDKHGKRFSGGIAGSYNGLVNSAVHFQGRDELMSFEQIIFQDRQDLRFAPEKRKEVYKQIGEEMNQSYYEMALKHGLDLGRFYK